MRNYLLVGVTLTMMLTGGAGCSTNDNYCCESNDLCLTTAEGLHSCSMDTCGKCVAVKPLMITVTDWKDPKVGQKNYSVELMADGGLTPYTWGDFTIVNDTGGKLYWLTLQMDANDSSKAYLTNNVVNNNILVPKEKSTEVLTIKVTVKDYTKRGTKMDRVDNTGYTFEHPIAINECPSNCANDDGCCPSGCNSINDNDCAPTCGNNVVETGETCDPPSSCPTSCDDSDGCTIDTTAGSATNCNVECTHESITQCNNNDGCCPNGCTIANDSDCTCACGNGAVEQACSETCDTAIPAGQPGACPTSCTAPDACTTSVLQGAGCKAKCVNTPITPCCGNGVKETGENCDKGITCPNSGCCPTSCNDSNVCTTDVLSGSATDCSAKCTFTPIVLCCGNGVVETGETCDSAIPTGQVGACPTTCADDGNACTSEVLTGSAATCNVACTHPAITQCTSGGGCCPPSIEGVSCNMKYVPGGTFLTGTGDLPGSQKTVSPGFWMGETEVTYKLWNTVYKWAIDPARGYVFANKGTEGNSGTPGDDPKTVDQPVTTITWQDAMVWCNAASQLAGLAPVYYYQNAVVKDSTYADYEEGVDDVTVDSTANGFRLPESMQWECAARYKDGTNWTQGSYASGATAAYTDFNADNAVAWFGNSTVVGTGNTTTTQPVRTRNANALGIYDMSGNVWEWCYNWSAGDRVARGGSFFNEAYYLQVGWEGRANPGIGYSYAGFRLVRTK